MASPPEKPIVLSAEKARGGVISGRVLTVLVVSLMLCAVAAIGLAIWWWRMARGIAP